MSKTTPELLLEIMELYNKAEWESKNPISKKKLNIILDKILGNISADEIIDNKMIKKIIDESTMEVKNDHSIEIKNNDIENDKAFNKYYNNRNFCNFKFTIKEIIYIIVLIILTGVSCYFVRKNELLGKEKTRASSILNEILYFISNLLSIN